MGCSEYNTKNDRNNPFLKYNRSVHYEYSKKELLKLNETNYNLALQKDDHPKKKFGNVKKVEFLIENNEIQNESKNDGNNKIMNLRKAINNNKESI